MMIMFTTIGAKDVVLLSTPCTKLLGGGSWGHKSTKAVVIMATPCTKSLGGGNWGHKRQRGCQGRKACWTFATVSWSGAGGRAVVRIGVNTKVSRYTLVLAIRSRGQPK